MWRNVRGVAALSACWFLGVAGFVGVVGAAAPSWGQPVPTAEPRPYFYLWEGPEVGGTNISSFASQMVWEYAEFPASSLWR